MKISEFYIEFNIPKETTSKNSWSVVTEICIGFRLRDTNVDSVFSVTSKRQRAGATRVYLETNLINTKYRIEPQMISGGATAWTMRWRLYTRKR